MRLEASARPFLKANPERAGSFYPFVISLGMSLKPLCLRWRTIPPVTPGTFALVIIHKMGKKNFAAFAQLHPLC